MSDAPWSMYLVIGAIPLVLAGASAFTKVTIVLSSVRVGMGAQQLLPVTAMFTLALMLTGVVMMPVLTEIGAGLAGIEGSLADLAREPRQAGVALQPLWAFAARHASPEELRFFADLNGVGVDAPGAYIPAFLVTELTEGLYMAAVILIPFVVVDVAIAQVASMIGMGNLQVALVALPLKLLLFLAAGGWDVVVRGLVEAYR